MSLIWLGFVVSNSALIGEIVVISNSTSLVEFPIVYFIFGFFVKVPERVIFISRGVDVNAGFGEKLFWFLLSSKEVEL